MCLHYAILLHVKLFNLIYTFLFNDVSLIKFGSLSASFEQLGPDILTPCRSKATILLFVFAWP